LSTHEDQELEAGNRGNLNVTTKDKDSPHIQSPEKGQSPSFLNSQCDRNCDGRIWCFPRTRHPAAIQEHLMVTEVGRDGHGDDGNQGVGVWTLIDGKLEESSRLDFC